MEELILPIPNKSGENVIKFLEKRFTLTKNYRGLSLSQHNRWNFEKFDSILSILNTYVKDDFFKIPTVDAKSYDNDNVIVKNFIILVDEIKLKTKYGTPNTIKKNIFTDLARMGAIDRFKQDKSNDIELTNPWVGHKVKYIKMSKLAIKYLNLESIESKKNMYKKFMQTILSPILSDLHRVICNLKYFITKDEFLIFFTFIGKKINEKFVDVKMIIDLITEYRESFDLSQKEELINILKKFMNPKIYEHVLKNEKRDWGNFKNQTSQIFSIIKTGKLFEVVSDGNGSEKIRLNCRKNANGGKDIKRRSQHEKKEFWKKHNLAKVIKEFQIDHLIPFSLSTDCDQNLLIDCWKNFFLISKNKHDIKNNNNNKYIKIEKCNPENFDVDKKIKLTTLIDNDFLLLDYGFDKDYMVNLDLIDTIIKYNEDLIRELF